MPLFMTPQDDNSNGSNEFVATLNHMETLLTSLKNGVHAP